MAIEIYDNGASLRIRVDEDTKYILKAKIKTVSIIKTDLIRLDLGISDLEDVFIPYRDVTAPVAATAEELRDTINDLLTAPPDAPFPPGLATESNQVSELSILSALNSLLDTISSLVASIERGVFDEPLRTEINTTGASYKGYALPGSLPGNSSWAILKTEHTAMGEISTWANGSKSLTNKWDLRTTLSYS